MDKSQYLLSQEYSQSKIRLIFIVSIFLYFSIFNIHKEVVQVAGGYFIFSLISIYFMVKYKKESYVRRGLNVIGDISAIALAMQYNDTNAIMMYPALLWIIIGNGMRFGVKCLLFTLGVAEVAYAFVLMTSTYWMTQKDVTYALLLGLVGLSLFYVLLVKKLHKANDILEDKVKKRTAKIEHIYLHDALTGLKNRVSLVKDFQKSRSTVLILLDIDDFHNYNELYGMEIGNRVLQKFALFLQESNIAQRYEIYRIHGDQFLLRGIESKVSKNSFKSDIKELINLVKHMNISIENLDDILHIDITLGVSVGNDKMLNMVEMALKYAKKTKKQYVIYSKDIDNSSYSQELLVWKDKIKESIAQNNIVPVYQSIVDKNNNIIKYETLMRLREVVDDKEKLISPFYFLDIAIKSKLYPQLTHIMIEKSFDNMSRNGTDFSINLTFDDMLNSDIVDFLREKIREYNIGKQLIFEIVESENIDDFVYAKKFVKEFKSMGVRIAIDDFGTGYSNFTHIIDLEPDTLKIDGSLIKNIVDDKKSYELVSSIVKFSKSLKIETVAEFVSSKEIFEICKDIGIDQFQGFYFCEPLLFDKLKSYELENRVVIAES